MRVRSWFSDYAYATGSIRLTEKISEKTLKLNQEIMAHISKYDHVEHLKGFFKLQQTDIHKSNVYSIQLTNTGLNPLQDLKLTYYTKQQAAELMQKPENNWLHIPLIYS